MDSPVPGDLAETVMDSFDETTEDDYDENEFIYPFQRWGSTLADANEQNMVKRGRTVHGQKLDPYVLHRKVIEVAGGYDAFLDETNTTHLKDLQREMLDFGTKNSMVARGNRRKSMETLRKYIRLLKKFVDYRASMRTDLDEAADTLPQASLAEVALSRLSMRAVEINAFIKEEMASKHGLNESIRKTCRDIHGLITAACKNLQEAIQNPWNGRRVLLWLGLNGIGKTVGLNLLLLLSESPPWLYGLRRVKAFEALSEAKPTHVNNGEQDVTESDDDEIIEKRISRGQLRNSLKHLAESRKGTTVVIVVEPEAGDFTSDSVSALPRQEEIRLEEEFLAVLKARAFSYGAWRELIIRRGGILPGYILTSASQKSFRSTTTHATNVRLGKYWHFEVVYQSLESLQATLSSYEFDINHRIYTNVQKGITVDSWTAVVNAKHEYMMHLLNAVLDREASEAAKSTQKEEEIEDDFGLDIELSLDPSEPTIFPKKGAPILFKESIKRIAGKRFVFLGKGEDALRDRIYIRRMLHGITFQGLFSNFKAPMGTSTPDDCVDEAAMSTDKMIAEAPDRFLISEINVYAPSVLLESDVEWQDAPGTNDDDPVKQTKLNEALEKCQGLMMFSERINDTSILAKFDQNIVPRLWERDSDLTRFGNFLLTEKSSTLEAVDIARDRRSQVRQMQELRKELMMPLFKKIMYYTSDVTRDTRLRELTQERVKKSLNVGTWQIHPLMYTSLIMNSDQRINFEEMSLNVLGPKTSDNKGAVRAIVKDAIEGTSGRNLIVSLLHVSQSSTQVVLDELRTQLRRAQRNIAPVKKEDIHDAPMSVKLAEPLLRIRRVKQASEPENGKMPTDLRKAAINSMYMRMVRSPRMDRASMEHALKPKIFAKFREPFDSKLSGQLDAYVRKADVAGLVNFYDKLNVWGGIIHEAAALVDVGNVSILLKSSLEDLFHDFEVQCQEWLVEMFMGTGKITTSEDQAWLREHAGRFVQTRLDPLMRQKLRVDYLVTLEPKGDDEAVQAALDSLRTELMNICMRAVTDKQSILRDCLTGHNKTLIKLRNDPTSAAKVIKNVIDDASEAFLVAAEKEIRARFVDLWVNKVARSVKALVDCGLSSVSSMMLTKMLEYVVGDGSRAKASADATSVTYALGFIRNKIDELIGNSQLLEVDGFWFETWAEIKFILSDFISDLRNSHAASLSDEPSHVSSKVDAANSAVRFIEGKPAPHARIKSARESKMEIGPIASNIDRSRLEGKDETNSQQEAADKSGVVLRRSDSLEGDLTGRVLTLKANGDSLMDGDPRPVRVKILKDSPTSVQCLFLGPSYLEAKGLQMCLKKQLATAPSRNKTTGWNLVDAIVKCACLDPRSARLLPRVWAKLLEAVFPRIDDRAPNASTIKTTDREVTQFYIKGKAYRACSTVFDHLLGFTLEHFLNHFESEMDSPEFVVALLMGAAEMASIPFLVNVDDQTYIVRPVFRINERSNRAYCLRWSAESGFVPEPDSTPSAPIDLTFSEPNADTEERIVKKVRRG